MSWDGLNEQPFMLNVYKTVSQLMVWQPLNGRLSRVTKFAINAYLKLFIEKSVINLFLIYITCKLNVLLAVLENKTAIRSGEVLTADMYWLVRKDNEGSFHNLRLRMEIEQRARSLETLQTIVDDQF